MRAASPSTAGASRIVLPADRSENPVSGRASARSVTASATCEASVAGDFRNFLRAGTAPKRSRASTVVPRG